MSEQALWRLRHTLVLVVVLVATVVVITSCSSDGGDADTSSAADDGAEAVDDTAADDGGDDGDPGDASDRDMAEDAALTGDGAVGSTGENTTLEPPALPEFTTALFVGRDIIFTGDIVLETPDVEATTRRVIDTVITNGGAIWGQDSASDPTPRTTLTIRVRPEDFPTLMALLTDLQGVGLISESITTDDVTERVVDLDARVTAADAGVARIQARLDGATDLTTIFTLEEELAARQAELERLLGQRKTLQDRVDLSTITVSIVEADPDRLAPEFEVVAWLGEDATTACPGVSDLSIEADGSAVLCVSVNNTGEDTLTDLDLAVPSLRLRVDDFTFEPGDASRDAVPAGEELLAYAVLEAEDGFIQRVDARDGLSIEASVTATPETSPTVELTRTDTVFISADGDDPLPGFGDSFADGWNAMVFVVSLLMIALGIVLPFLPFVAVAWWLGHRLIARSRARDDERRARIEAHLATTAAGVTAAGPDPNGPGGAA